MTIALWVLAVLLISAGLAGIVLPALPGVPLVFFGILAAAGADGFTRIGAWTIGLCGFLAAAAVAIDYLAGVLGAKRMGATPWGMVGAIAGTLIGIFFGIPGLILGPAVGAVAFEYWKDPDFKKAAKAGGGVVVGFAIGVVAKCALAFAMLGIAALAWFL